jgi:hypothetical protein
VNRFTAGPQIDILVMTITALCVTAAGGLEISRVEIFRIG